MCVQGGSGHHIVSPSVYNYVRGMDVADIFASIDEVPKPDVKEIAQKVVNFYVYSYLLKSLLCI